MTSTDLGYFGPDSVTWRVHGEPVSMVGGLRALLLQALHPGAMALLYSSSNFQDDPWARLQRTVGYVATLSFAPREAADRAAERVRAVHASLGVTDTEQLAWVHLCLVDSFLTAARASGLGLSTADTDRYVDEQAIAARLVAVPDELVPHTQDELTEAIARMRPRLRGTREAREAARYVIAPPLPIPVRYRIPARAGWTTVSSLAVGLLPPWARRMYRLPPAPGAGLVASAGLRTLRTAVRVLPARYREGPAYRAAKARAAADRGPG
ncbi:MAG TPA: oxygenase MpaB family protein [Jatrophihabitantaceae bacterium]|nr:oxygenase MpaB family protein [Jatrophihabitantaceae bacterium]